MSVGVIAHLFGCLPYRELAAKIGASGFAHVQLALWKAIRDVDFSRPGKLSPGLAMDIAEQFDRHGVSVSVLGCYLNMFDRDEDRRREHVARFKELLRHARYFGAPTVAFETGTYPDGVYTERDWHVMKGVLEELAEEAQRWGVYVGLEAADGHLVGTASELKRMLEEVPSEQIGVVLDPGNLLNEDNFGRQDDVIEEAFRLLGSRVIACHAKDKAWADGGKLASMAPGLGTMNYPLYLERLEQYKPGVHIIMEETAESDMFRAKSHIESIRFRYSGRA